MDKCIHALKLAYKSWDEGKAINRPRTDLVMPSSSEAGVYAFKSMEAGLYDPPIVALRINSDIIRWQQQGSRIIKTKIPAAAGDKYVGLVMLFSTFNGEPLAIFPDGVVQRMRVAASSALAASYLARHNAERLALLGSGWQAAREAKSEHPFWLAAPELRDLVTGRASGRSDERESTYFLNNIGIGLQFAAVGASVLAEAKSAGAGHEIPTDWFLETVHP